jgi:hypothetical protein
MPADPPIPTTAAELAATLRAAARQVPPLADLGPWDFLLRAPRDVLLGPAREALRALTLDDDPEVRGLALGVWLDLPTGEDTVAWLLEVARVHADRFGAQEVTGLTLRERLIHSLGNAAAICGREREVALTVAALIGQGPPVDSVGMLLARHLPDETIALVARHAADPRHQRFCVHAAAGAALHRRDRLAELLRAMRDLPDEGKRAVVDELEGWLAVDAARAATLCARAGIDPPRGAPPTMAACRDALGLV